MNALTAPSIRINARLSGQAVEDLAVIKAFKDMSVSEILRASLAMYRKAVAKQKPAPLSALGKHIGKYDSGGDGTLSVTYKAEIAKYLDRKYPRQ
jgi:hypothetical protein